MNATATGNAASLESKAYRIIESFLAGLARWLKADWSSAEVRAFYLHTAPAHCAQSHPATVEGDCEVKAPHRVQVCDLRKDEAEELLDCLEHEHGPYLFIECTLGPRGYTISYLTRRWRPQGPVRKSHGLNGLASEALRLPDWLRSIGCRVEF
jgi:hypothetical protein